MNQRKRQPPHLLILNTAPSSGTIYDYTDWNLFPIQQMTAEMQSEGKSYPTAENHNVSAIRLILFYTYFLSSICSSPMNVFDSSLHAIWISFLVIFYAESAYLPRKNINFFFFIKNTHIYYNEHKYFVNWSRVIFVYFCRLFVLKATFYSKYQSFINIHQQKRNIQMICIIQIFLLSIHDML